MRRIRLVRMCTYWEGLRHVLTYLKGLLRRYVIGLLYPAGGGRSRLLRIPVDRRFTDEPGSIVWAEDLQTRRWFPRGSRRVRITSLPSDHTFVLANSYSVITSRCSATTTINRTVRTSWGLVVRGHVLVVRHAARDEVRLTNVLNNERRLVDYVVRS